MPSRIPIRRLARLARPNVTEVIAIALAAVALTVVVPELVQYLDWRLCHHGWPTPFRHFPVTGQDGLAIGFGNRYWASSTVTVGYLQLDRMWVEADPRAAPSWAHLEVPDSFAAETTHATGWPFLWIAHSESFNDITGARAFGRPFLIASGVALNLLVYVALGLLALQGWQWVQYARGRRRRARGCCPSCAYPLRNAADGPCPECGCAAHLASLTA